MKTIIAGGGIAGLGAAKARLENNDRVTIIDQNKSLGGLSRSYSVNGFIFDYAGHLFHLNNSQSLSEISPLLREDEWSTQKRHSGAFWNSQLIDAPFQYNLYQLNTADAEQFRKSYLVAQGNQFPTMSFKDYLINNFGEKLAKEFLIPYNEKILGVNLDSISHNAVTRFFPPPKENLLLVKTVQAVKTYNTNFWYPLKTGIGLLVDSLVKEIEGHKNLTIRTGEKILNIDPYAHIVYTDKNRYKYDVIISSVPLNSMIKIVVDSELGSVNALSASKVICLNIGYRKPIKCFEKYHWVYFPEKNIPMYRIGFYSKFNDYMAPRGMESAYVECGVDFNKKVNMTEQIRLILDCLTERFKFSRESIEVIVSHIINPGFVHYTHDRLPIVEDIITKLKSYSIYQIGRYGLWQYNSMEDSYYTGYKLSLESMISLYES